VENRKKMKDFISSIVLILLSFFVFAEGRNIYVKAGKLWYLSPALIPLMLGMLLLALSVVLMATSLKDGGISARMAEFKDCMKDVKGDPNSMRMLIGVVVMGLYTFVLLGLFPFWLATFLFMFLLMYFLDAGSLVKILLVSVVVTMLIILLFEVCFRVPLP